jgi:hypothetical protein
LICRVKRRVSMIRHRPSWTTGNAMGMCVHWVARSLNCRPLLLPHHHPIWVHSTWLKGRLRLNCSRLRRYGFWEEELIEWLGE